MRLMRPARIASENLIVHAATAVSYTAGRRPPGAPSRAQGLRNTHESSLNVSEVLFELGPRHAASRAIICVGTHLAWRHSTAASASLDFTAKHTLCSDDACRAETASSVSQSLSPTPDSPLLGDSPLCVGESWGTRLCASSRCAAV